ncbi:MAG TPA: SDR family NAD(P)-dependent oxidoreductase [Tepidisphaeraceae bacterium]|nr:SDR family NAD(P)-dependent oxidoreductase [Tepidisphaeraceae bacterium]
MRPIRGMVVVITGASAGIGRALAEELARRGASLALAARRLDRLEELNRSLGGGHLCVPTDVSQRDQCEALVGRTAAHFGRVDTLVCNAGYGILRRVSETTPQQMQEIFQTNVFGTVDCVRAAVPVMLGQAPAGGWRGQVVIVSSAVARRGLPFFGAYSATKAAQLSLAEAMRVELRDQGVAVTTVHPIGTDTEFGDAAFARAGGGRIARIPGEVRQTAAQVASSMVKAIERPRPEVWPYPPSRLALGFATLMPRLVDRIMSKRVTVEQQASGGDG